MSSNLILIKNICLQYEVEVSFIESLSEYGLVQIQNFEDEIYLEENTLGNFEKIIRLHHELNINPEGIDVILNLMEKIDHLNLELTQLKKRIYLLEE